MSEETKLTDELYESIKEHIKSFTTEEILKWRNNMLDSGKIDNRLLEIFNAELLGRAFEEGVKNRL